METDIGNPIDYDPSVEPLRDEKIDNDRGNDHLEDSTQIDPYYYQSPPQQLIYQQPEKTDIFSNIEKSTWIIAFAVFLLGFFMGKTMQPVILRYT